MNKKGFVFGAAFLLYAIIGLFLFLNIGSFAHIINAVSSNPILLLIGLAVLALFITRKR